MMDENEQNELLIPANVSTRFELFTGVGIQEIVITLICAAVGLLLFFLLGLPQHTVVETVKQTVTDPSTPTQVQEVTKNVTKSVSNISTPIRAFVFIIIAGMGFIFSKKNDANKSILDFIFSVFAFMKSQKQFFYRKKSCL
jgi:hypothetical protein